ncbi:YdeI/OmpD-associated family protein [Collimonas silvisoli]|uniref:YdeI/OmpD-associated family protein n=1 Tax=Collimonas silvisoli TaxID=2825884 RepID=UPI0038B373E4
MPTDFQAALDASPRAQAFFATLNSSNRYAVLFRIQTAKKAETRAKRIQDFTRMLDWAARRNPSGYRIAGQKEVLIGVSRFCSGAGSATQTGNIDGAAWPGQLEEAAPLDGMVHNTSVIIVVIAIT